MALLERFRNDGGRLISDALREQALFSNTAGLVEKVLPQITVIGLQPGETLIRQGTAENDLFFILAGEFSIVVNGRPIARRGPREQLGEMSVVDPSAVRSATVIALSESVVAKLPESTFSRIGAKNPDLWRRVAVSLAARLRQRNNLVSERRERSILFIGSTREALPAATALSDCFASESFGVRLWTDSVFEPSKVNIEALENQVKLSDFAVLVLTPDDRLTSRGTDYLSPRDNIIFELGLFMGSVGRARTFLLMARGSDLKIPSDLLGVNPLEYELDVLKPIIECIVPASEKLRTIIARLGPL